MANHFSELIKLIKPELVDPKRLNEFIQLWDKSMQINQGEVGKSDLNYSIFDVENIMPDRAFGIFDSRSFSWPIFGKNIQNIVGFNAADLSNQRLVLLSNLSPIHYPWPIYVTTFIGNIIANREHEDSDIIICSVGIKFKHKSGHYVKLLFVAKSIEIHESRESGFWFGYCIDISHLMKTDDFWSRGTVGTKDGQAFHAISNESYAFRKGDILSVREKEILKLIDLGKSTAEIAAELFISPTTVETHRKNMLKRTGTRDTSCLIHLCRMIGIV
jgi:DNA-binding CsgD family transcriptional regulator